MTRQTTHRASTGADRSRRLALASLLWPLYPLGKRRRGEGECLAGNALFWTGIVLVVMAIILPSYDSWWWLDRTLIVVGVIFVCLGGWLFYTGRKAMREADRAALDAEELRRS